MNSEPSITARRAMEAQANGDHVEAAAWMALEDGISGGAARQ